MKVNQIYEIMNSVTNEVLGKSDVVKEDLTNIADVGTEIFDSASVDNYVKSLVNHIGKVIFVDRPYQGDIPSIMMDSWEFGSILEKVHAELPTASETNDWNLENGKSYSTDIFYQPKVSAKFFNKKVTFEVDLSFTEKQVKESFSNSNQLNGFLTMLYNAVDKSMTIKIDSLVMSTINNMAAETIYNEYSDGVYTGKSGIRAINLLHEFNSKFEQTLTAEKAITNPEFIRYASMRIALVSNRMSKISTLFNLGGKEKFTPSDMQKIVMLTDFKVGADSYLQSELFHEKYTALPNCDTVPYWQGSGTNYDFSSISKINVKTSSGHDVEIDGIIAVIFDRDSVGVANLDRRVTTSYNAKAEFYTNFYKFDAGYFNDTNENYVVFFVK